MFRMRTPIVVGVGFALMLVGAWVPAKPPESNAKAEKKALRRAGLEWAARRC